MTIDLNRKKKSGKKELEMKPSISVLHYPIIWCNGVFFAWHINKQLMIGISTEKVTVEEVEPPK